MNLIYKNILFLMCLMSVTGCFEQFESKDVIVYEMQNLNLDPHERSLGNNVYSWTPSSSWVFFEESNLLQDALFFAGHSNDPFIENDHLTARISVSYFEESEINLLDNLNRWKSQLSTDLSRVKSELVDLQTASYDWKFAKLSFENKAIYVAFTTSFDGTLFIKMEGVKQTLNEQTSNFIQFIESVKRKKDV